MKILRCSGYFRLFQIFPLFFVFGYLCGILNIYFSDSKNYCVMTYMFEYPQFVRITVPESKDYPQYGLYAYSEGRYTERARKMWFDGVPVLYLPGNSGSHMQARSLASVALRKSLERGYEFHFDFFTISYNEELSGMYGGVLHSQTQFASACISKILSLYKSNKYTKTVPTSVILVGHSMGGLIAKRLLVYPSTINTTSVAITLAAPLEAPVINFDATINDYYMQMKQDWDIYNAAKQTDNKLLISFGNGARDQLMPSGLTSSNVSYINALTTSIPGVWVSPDHVSIVWCKQLVLAINRFIFSAVDVTTHQISEDKQLLMAKAKDYFRANRSMTLDPQIKRANNIPMLMDAFWYEDNRRIYQINRPEIDKTTYLMIRLVTFPQNRFVAIESVNLDDKDWIFGCNAKFTHNAYRYCKQATSLTELSRWTAAAAQHGKRKLATINLHSIKEEHPDWTHIVVKASPTRKPISLNVDVNDYASRQITVDVPYDISFSKSIIRQETEPNSLYYELILRGFNKVHQAFLLYVEPTASCQSNKYHVSAELHVPWAENHEYFHYFTSLKRSPMKLRLFKTNPNLTMGLEPIQYAKVTLLLDPQCTYTISIAASCYHSQGQIARHYTPVLIPYIAGVVVLAAAVTMNSLKQTGKCISMHTALMSDGVKPYYVLVFSRFATMAFGSIPVLSFLFENASGNNIELLYFNKSLLVLPLYMTALGIVNIAVAGVLVVMVFSSQLAHRLLFRIVWRGSSGLAEKLATGLQKVPLVVSAALVCAAPVSCGAASLAAGAAFYAFMLSKMYEEYLEDYVYKLMAKAASRFRRVFKSKVNRSETSLVKDSDDTNDDTNEKKAIAEKEESSDDEHKEVVKVTEKADNKDSETKLLEITDSNKKVAAVSEEHEKLESSNDANCNESKKDRDEDETEKSEVDEELSNLNFHMMMFLLWLVVAIVNIPALLTWARNFKYSMVLKPDTSYHTGLVMSLCSTLLWQIQAPRRNLTYDDAVKSMIFTMAIFILALGPMSLVLVNYGVTLIFCIITVQQVFDKEIIDPNKKESKIEVTSGLEDVPSCPSKKSETDKESHAEDKSHAEEKGQTEDISKSESDSEQTSADSPVNSESMIYNVFKNLREKFNFHEDL